MSKKDNNKKYTNKPEQAYSDEYFQNIRQRDKEKGEEKYKYKQKDKEKNFRKNRFDDED